MRVHVCVMGSTNTVCNYNKLIVKKKQQKERKQRGLWVVIAGNELGQGNYHHIYNMYVCVRYLTLGIITTICVCIKSHLGHNHHHRFVDGEVHGPRPRVGAEQQIVHAAHLGLGLRLGLG